jgi:manganese transport protein
MAKDKPSPMEHSSTERATALILSGKGEKRGLARLLPFMGPAFIASVAYMDPGNFDTIISPIGGSSGCGY